MGFNSAFKGLRLEASIYFDIYDLSLINKTFHSSGPDFFFCNAI
jgi:hypothetical protein